MFSVAKQEPNANLTIYVYRMLQKRFYRVTVSVIDMPFEHFRLVTCWIYSTGGYVS